MFEKVDAAKLHFIPLSTNYHETLFEFIKETITHCLSTPFFYIWLQLHDCFLLDEIVNKNV